ncbi:MAG: hypothetical protein AB8B79_11150 [Granulosicoccus sp.]
MTIYSDRAEDIQIEHKTTAAPEGTAAFQLAMLGFVKSITLCTGC